MLYMYICICMYIYIYIYYICIYTIFTVAVQFVLLAACRKGVLSSAPDCLPPLPIRENTLIQAPCRKPQQ